MLAQLKSNDVLLNSSHSFDTHSALTHTRISLHPATIINAKIVLRCANVVVIIVVVVVVVVVAAVCEGRKT